MNHWGYHLMLDCSRCDFTSISDRNNIYQFVKTLIEKIEMIAHSEPIIEYLLPGEPNQGYSLMQLITTSNICAHFVETNRTAYIDIFSCKKFDINVAEDIVNNFFKPEKVRINFITRHAD